MDTVFTLFATLEGALEALSSQPISFFVTFSVTSGVFAAREALAKLLDGLAPLQLDSEDADSIKLVLD